MSRRLAQYAKNAGLLVLYFLIVLTVARYTLGVG